VVLVVANHGGNEIWAPIVIFSASVAVHRKVEGKN